MPYQEKIMELGMTYGSKLIFALLTLIIGLFIVKIFTKYFVKIMQKSKVDTTLSTFLGSFISIALKVVLFVIVAATLGVEVTSFVAILGAAGLAVGLALQGSLSNFAGGVLILIFRPFNVGDFIEAQGHLGTVEAIQILYTVLITVDNKKVVIPNGNLSNGSITNFSAMDTRRVDLVFGVGYDSDIDKVKKILMDLVSKHELILKTPEPFVRPFCSW